MCIELFVIFSDDGLNFCGICGDFPFIIFLGGGRKAGREGRRTVGRKEGMKEGRKGGSREGGREGGREEREGRKSSNERDIADLDLEVYKLISFFLRERKKKKK